MNPLGHEARKPYDERECVAHRQQHDFRPSVRSCIPQTPTVRAITPRNTTYAAIYASATAADGAMIAARIVHGKPCVKINPTCPAGRE